jgi:hypothetical protein
MPVLRPLTVSILFTASCAVEHDTSLTTSALACSQWVCGENGPQCGGTPMDELHPTETSPDGFRILTFTKDDGTPMKVRVVGAELTGTSMIDGSEVKGDDLHSSRLQVEDTVNDQTYDVTLVGIDDVDYYEDGKDHGGVQSYKFEYTVPGSVTPRLLCPTDEAKYWGGAPHHAVIFGGDRFDKAKGTITAVGGAAGDWFNIACIGDAKSKLLIMGHAEAALEDGLVTAQRNRIAALRMLRADYCGTGVPHTIAGVDLDWKNRGGWMYLDQAPNKANIEAIWNHTGALCITNPRHEPLAALECVKPKCSDKDIANWKLLGGTMMTIIP